LIENQLTIFIHKLYTFGCVENFLVINCSLNLNNLLLNKVNCGGSAKIYKICSKFLIAVYNL